MRAVTLAMSVLIAAVSPLTADPLYLGTQEIDTEDHDALAALVRHCTDLAGSQTDVPPAPDPIAAAPEPHHYSEPIAIDALASSGDDAAAAGEGTGSDMPASRDDDEPEKAIPALAEITLEMCKEAGILY